MERRLTMEAKRVIGLAESEALRLGYSYIGTEHILLGILASGGGLAYTALQPYGIERLQREVVRTCPPGPTPVQGRKLGLSPRAHRVLSELAFEEAQRLGNSHAGSEHLLLAIIGLSEGVAVGVLENARLDLTALRKSLAEQE